ncbi:hypothetical protein ACFLUP_00315 [Chloroflexota bacterium]
MITTVTTVTTVAALGISAVMSVAAVITLIVFLTTRELAAASNYTLPSRIARFASVGILPLVIAFAVIVLVKIFDIL